MDLLKNITCVRINRNESFLHLYGFIRLGGSIQSDNNNGIIENITCDRINSYREIICTSMASYS